MRQPLSSPSFRFRKRRRRRRRRQQWPAVNAPLVSTFGATTQSSFICLPPEEEDLFLSSFSSKVRAHSSVCLSVSPRPQLVGSLLVSSTELALAQADTRRDHATTGRRKMGHRLAGGRASKRAAAGADLLRAGYLAPQARGQMCASQEAAIQLQRLNDEPLFSKERKNSAVV